MKKTKISIIVPCYNVEQYIKKCLDSLIKQTLEGIEIIAVDDGSKDKTGDILDKYAKKYKQLRVFHIKNKGVSHARNFALTKAKGDYIAFLDSDDWLAYDALEKLYIKAEEGTYDLVACDTNAIYPDKSVIISSNVKDNCSEKELMLNAYAVLWNKIYKKEILKGIKFNENITFCEDVLYLYQVYSRVKKVGAIDEALHFYLQRTGSLTNVYDKKIYNIIECMDSVVELYKKNNLFDKYESEIEYSYVRYLYATFIKRLAKTKNRKEFVKGYKFVIGKVNSVFPKYKKNIYINNKSGKSLYLKYFNRIFAEMIYLLEKNKMN